MSDVIDRFLAKVNKTETCWLWTGCKSPSRRSRTGVLWYGYFSLSGKMVRASRFSYEASVGPIPPGLTIDHVKARGCTSTLCVNPAHLEAVTLQENIMRSGSAATLNSAKILCKHGHRLEGDNVWMEKGRWRQCRMCARRRMEEFKARRAAEAASA